ncbi:periplasmic glucan biosynthesis protein MdoG, partial [mine drainage metagenome]
PAAIRNLSWNQWETISYRPNRELWYGDNLFFRVRFDHLGYTMKRPVTIYSLENGLARQVLFEPGLFDYSGSG